MPENAETTNDPIFSVSSVPSVVRDSGSCLSFVSFVSFVVVQFAPGGPVERVIAQLSGAAGLNNETNYGIVLGVRKQF